MSKVAELRGIIAVSLDKGKNIGKIKRVLIDKAAHSVWGITLMQGGFFGAEFILPVKKLKKLGEDFLLVKSGSDLQDFEIHDAENILPETVNILNDMIGFDVTSSTGKHLGNLLDIEIETSSWKINGFYLSGGKTVTDLTSEVIFGDDVIIVPPTVTIEEYEQPENPGQKSLGILARTIGREGFNEITDAVERIVKRNKGKDGDGAKKETEEEK